MLRRKKDNPGLKSTNNNAKVIKTYYIKSKEHLFEVKDEIVELCKIFNARAGINLNKRSFRKCSFQTARLILDQISNNDYYHAHKAFNSICGKYSPDSDKKWILDYDNGEIDKIDRDWICTQLKYVQPEGDKVIQYIPTKNGTHIITKPFNLVEAEDIIKNYNLDVHKNNPTILYIP